MSPGILLVLLLLGAVSLGAQEDEPRKVLVGTPQVLEDEVLTAVEISDASDVIAGDVDLVLDADIVDVAEVRAGDLLRGFALFYNQTGDTLKVSFAGAQATSGEGTLFHVVTRGTRIPGFGLSLVSLNGDQISVRYERPTVVTGIRQPQKTVPPEIGLRTFPNPFNAETVIAVDLAQPEAIRLAIYNTQRQLVRLLICDDLPSGHHSFRWDGRGDLGHEVASGLYLAELATPRHVSTAQLTLVR